MLKIDGRKKHISFKNDYVAINVYKNGKDSYSVVRRQYDIERGDVWLAHSASRKEAEVLANEAINTALNTDNTIYVLCHNDGCRLPVGHYETVEDMVKYARILLKKFQTAVLYNVSEDKAVMKLYRDGNENIKAMIV